MGRGESLMNKARITYRFEHRNRDVNVSRVADEPAKVIPLDDREYKVLEGNPPGQPDDNDSADPKPLNQFTTDFGVWSSPFDAETQKIEELIRGSSVDPETGYYGNRNTRSSGHYGRERDYTELPPLREPEYVRHPETPWLRIVFAVTGAVATGLFFGFFVLTMFMDRESSVDTPSEQAALPEKTAIQEEIADGGALVSPDSEEQADTAPAPASTPASSTDHAVAVDVPAQSYFVLQSGVFSSLEGAEAAQEQLRQKGPAAIAATDNQYRVYVGLTKTRDDALLLSNRLQEDNKEIIIKQIDIPELHTIKWNGGGAEPVNSYFAQGHKLVQMMSALSLVHLQEAKPLAFEDSTIQSLKTEHQAWTGLTAAVRDGLPEAAKPIVQKMENAMNTAVKSLEEYKRNPSFAFLWQAQTALMQYIVAEKELLAVASAE